MRVWKRSILLFVGIAVLLLSTLTVSAESDGTGDVWHWKYSETGYSWEHSGGKPNIDITSVSHTITGSEVTLTMTVAGTIEDSEKIIYLMYLVGDGETICQASYINGEGGYLAGLYQGGDLVNPVSGNTFTATFEIDDPSATYSVWAYSSEHATGDESGEAWWDYAPNTYSPWYTGGASSGGTSGGTGGGIPGFEILAVIAAIGVALIILRRRK